MPKALITGAQGQDGFYLAELLRAKRYEVIEMNEGVTDPYRVAGQILNGRPDEVYNLAAITRPMSVEEAYEVNFHGAANVFDAADGCRIFQASSCEVTQGRQTPYASAKRAAHELAAHLRAEGRWIATGVLYNHESPRRTADFVSQKICRAAARKERVTLGNLDAKRDWGHAKDYVRAMWLIMQQSKPDEYDICTGLTHSVREICRIAYGHVGLDWRDFVTGDVGSDAFNPGRPDALRALGWTPEITFEEMIEEMVDAAAQR